MLTKVDEQRLANVREGSDVEMRYVYYICAFEYVYMTVRLCIITHIYYINMIMCYY